VRRGRFRERKGGGAGSFVGLENEKRVGKKTLCAAAKETSSGVFFKMARRLRSIGGPRVRARHANGRSIGSSTLHVPSARGVRDARRAVGVVIATGCLRERRVRVSKWILGFVSLRRENACEKRKAGNDVHVSVDALERAIVLFPSNSFRTYLAPRRARRTTRRSPTKRCRA